MKSRQSIRILIALMSLALLGVIIIQFLWIKNALQMKQEQCERSISAALVRVSADLENKYGVHWITEKLTSDSNVRKEVLSEDPGFYKFMISVNDGRDATDDGDVDTEQRDVEERLITAIDGDTINSHYSDQADRGTPQNRLIKVVHVKRHKKPEMVANCTLGEVPEPPTPPAPPPSPAKAGKLINIVKSAANEWAMSKMSASDISEALDSGEIRSTIEKEFHKQGLYDRFEFATYSMAGDSLIINKKGSKNPLNDFSYHAPLIATDFIEGGTMLLLNFPQHFKYLFASIASMLALSLLFTLSLIATFAYSLHVIFKQKKISDITNDFINNMTHELKTPLATISMTADTLALPSVNQNTGLVAEYSGMIKNEVKKLAQHVDRILEAALLEKNGKDRQQDLVVINQLIEDELVVFKPRGQQLGGSLMAQLPADPVRICANTDLLRSAISNLLDNAIKYAQQAPEINVALKVVSGKALLSISDKGIGVNKADQTLIFEKFYRAHTGNRHDVKGFGLGLSFVKDVIENLKGRVWVESELGKGSTFFIEIPIS